MGNLAKVTSTDAVQRMATALDCFKEQSTAALDNLQMELQRALDWIRHDRKEFWDQEVRRGRDRVAEARADLERRRTFHSIGDYQPACREEKMALEKAKRRLRVAEEKVEVVRRWRRNVEHELTEFQGAVNQLASWLQSEEPRAAADLKRMIAALESYVALSTPAAERVPARQGVPETLPKQTDEPPKEPADESMGPEHGRGEPGRREEDAADGPVGDGGPVE